MSAGGRRSSRRTIGCLLAAVVAIAAGATFALSPAFAEPRPEPAGARNLTDPTGAATPGGAGAPVIMDTAQPAPAAAVPTSTGFDYPVGTGRMHGGYEMNNCFGCDYLYYWGHEGEDFDNGREGDWVYSASEGLVVWRGLGPGAWGNVMIIQHNISGHTLYTQYAHMRDMLVSVGDVVGRRQIIGTVGTTGTTAPHLHFEIKDRPLIGHGYIGWYFTPRNTVYDPDTEITYLSPSWFINNNRYYWDQWPVTPVPEGRHYYWTWYDNYSARNWVLLANPAGGNTLSFDVNVRGYSPTLSQFGGGGTVGAGQVKTPSFPWLAGGPVVATSLTGGPALVSQRILWGTHSIEEVPGIEAGRLSSHYYWPWYDMKTPGFKNWVLVANPSTTETVTARVSFRDINSGSVVTGHYDIAPGASATPQFAGRIGGPVEVKAWVKEAGSSWDDPADRRPVIASQRLLLNSDKSFNEMPGIPAEELADHYYWTWYDEGAVSRKDWVLIANPSSSETVNASVTFRNQADGAMITAVHEIGPGLSVTPRFTGRMGGPVEVKAWVREDGSSWDDPADRRPVIATQRSLWGGFSFDEVPGVAAGDLAPEQHWTWYDMQSAAMKNWVLVSNINSFAVEYEITVAGFDTSGWPGARGTVPAGENANVVFTGRMGGPVTVRAWTDQGPAPVLASQRVLYNGYFNEVTGTVLSDPV
ncbi:MAG: M23 family metallopeptidase [Thermoleophilia bacterium]